MNSTRSYRMPAELVRLVFNDVDDLADLAALTRCSRFFQAESQRLLYRSMTHKNGTVHFKFFSTIVKKPHLASMVQVYHRHSDAHAQRRPLTTLIIRALPLMNNLKELIFGQDALWLDVRGLPAFIGPKCSFQLETLVSAKGRAGFEDIMNTVLESNISQTLRSLYCTHVDQKIKDLFTNNMIPQLTSFSGPLELVKFLLPGRNVVSLKIISDIYQMENKLHFQGVKTDLRRIESLCLVEHWHRTVHPRQFFQLMPSLQTVEIRDLTLEVSYVIRSSSVDS